MVMMRDGSNGSQRLFIVDEECPSDGRGYKSKCKKQQKERLEKSHCDRWIGERIMAGGTAVKYMIGDLRAAEGQGDFMEHPPSVKILNPVGFERCF